MTRQHQSKAGRIGGRVTAEKKVGCHAPKYSGLGGRTQAANRTGMFAPEMIGMGGRTGGPRGMHNRWHVARGIKNPNCELCMGRKLPSAVLKRAASNL